MATTTYSYVAVTGSFSHPVAGTFQFAGQVGIGQIEIALTTERTAQDISADNAVMISAIAGQNGTLTMQVQQTSALDQFLLNWFSDLDAAFNQQDVSNWATATMFIIDQLTGNQHTLTGVSPTKQPNRPYAKQGAMLSWVLMAAQILTQAGAA